jgi:DDE domain
LDEGYLKIDGRMVYLWRAVDAEGEVLDGLCRENFDDAARDPLALKAGLTRRSPLAMSRTRRLKGHALFVEKSNVVGVEDPMGSCHTKPDTLPFNR